MMNPAEAYAVTLLGSVSKLRNSRRSMVEFDPSLRNAAYELQVDYLGQQWIVYRTLGNFRLFRRQLLTILGRFKNDPILNGLRSVIKCIPFPSWVMMDSFKPSAVAKREEMLGAFLATMFSFLRRHNFKSEHRILVLELKGELESFFNVSKGPIQGPFQPVRRACTVSAVPLALPVPEKMDVDKQAVVLVNTE